jgi:phosphatidyl-myo-inositol dimannoside synthase
LKPAYYDAADIFVMPVRREGASVEGFGIVYMEAAYYGLPSLAGQEGGAVDAVLDEQTGLIVDGRNQQAIIAQLLRLLGDHDLRDRLGHAARHRAQTLFVWPEAIKAYLALCDQTV